MIFAALNYEGDYSRQHRLLHKILAANFPDVQEGLQGDSWIQILRDGQKVSLDSFTSMTHEVKARSEHSDFANEVIAILSRSYKVTVLDPPQIEAHE